MKAFRNCDIYTSTSVEHGKALLVDGDRIAGLVEDEDVPPEVESINLHGLSIAPGFIDLQVNGGGGILFNDDPTEATLSAIVAAHERSGTLWLLPTYITGPVEGMRTAAAAVVTAHRSRMPGVLGIHFEGPFISKDKLGVHEKRYARVPTPEDLSVVLACASVPTLITLAAEVVPVAAIKQLASAGVRVSLGHTGSTYQQAMTAMDAGASSATHLFNAMSALTSREPGVVGWALDQDSVYVGIIVDGHHADYASLRIAVRSKPRGKVLLVTDAMPSVGSSCRDFQLGELSVTVRDGKCVTSAGVLAGSNLDMASAVRNCVQGMGVPIEEALRMASLTPAELMGVDALLGRIAPGYRADLVVFDAQINVKGIVRSGEWRQF